MGVRVAGSADENGFSLIEVAISLAIVSIALVPTAQMWVGISQANLAIGQKAQALVVAQQVLERDVRGKAFASQSVGSTVGSDATSGMSYVLEITAPSPTVLRAEVNVSAPGAGGSLIRMVTLTAKEAD